MTSHDHGVNAVLDRLNPNILKSVDRLADQFKAAEPFPHLVIDDFFESSFCQSILDDFPAFDVGSQLNEAGEPGQKSTVEAVDKLGHVFNQLDALLKSNAFRSLLEQITGIRALRYDPHYFGGGTHENRQGQSLDPHVDFSLHPIFHWQRRLNLIIYLNPSWEQAWGGQIQLHKNPRLPPEEDTIVSVEPCMNRAVLFATDDRSWHGFPAINLPDSGAVDSRRSFAVYYYTENDESLDAVHSTIYVDRHLDPNLQAGHRLTDEDVEHINTLIRRRDDHLARLYQALSREMTTVSRLNRLHHRIIRISAPFRRFRDWLFRRN